MYTNKQTQFAIGNSSYFRTKDLVTRGFQGDPPSATGITSKIPKTPSCGNRAVRGNRLASTVLQLKIHKQYDIPQGHLGEHKARQQA